MLSVLSTNRAALAIIHQAPSLHMGQYATDWRWQGGNKFAQSQALWMISQLLEFEVLVHAEDGDVRNAMVSLLSLIDLGRSLDLEPSFAWQQARILCFNRAFIGLEWLLTKRSLADSDLQILQERLTALPHAISFGQALNGLRCEALEWRKARPMLPPLTGLGAPPLIEVIRAQLRYHVRSWSGASDRDFIAFLDAIDESARMARAPELERFQKARKLAPATPALPNQYLAHDPTIDPKSVFRSVIAPQMEFLARCRAVSAALALERFRLRHGARLPTNLTELVPEFLPELPMDPIDGQPMRYTRLSKGYRIYSLGQNSRDDNGTEIKNQWMLAPGTDSDVTFAVGR